MKHSSKINLVSKTYVVDAIGQRIATDVLKEIWCDFKSVSGQEFAQAGANGIKARFVFAIWEKEYNNETELIFDGVAYSIYRTYSRDDGRIELYTEKRVGVDE